MKKTLSLLTLCLAALSLNPAHAHGDQKPLHGGIVVEVNEIHYELVRGASGVALYLSDHGKPLAPTGVSGKLTVLAAGKSSEVPLTTAADKLEAKGLQLPKGAKVVAVLTTADKKAVTVRFTLK